MDEKLILRIKEILGENLTSVATYGKEDEQLLVVVNKLDFGLLKAVQDMSTGYYKKSGKLPLFLTEEELTDGHDVFPLEFLNIKLNHKIIYGTDIFTELQFDKNHVRRELEFEFRSKLINLRQGYLELAKSKKDLRLLVNKAVPTLLPICNGLLFVKDVVIPDSITELFTAINKEYGVNIDILTEIHEININKVSEEQLRGYVDRLMQLLSNLGEQLDEMKI